MFWSTPDQSGGAPDPSRSVCRWIQWPSTPDQSSGTPDYFTREHHRSAVLAWRTGGTPDLSSREVYRRSAKHLGAPDQSGSNGQFQSSMVGFHDQIMWQDMWQGPVSPQKARSEAIPLIEVIVGVQWRTELVWCPRPQGKSRFCIFLATTIQGLGL